MDFHDIVLTTYTTLGKEWKSQGQDREIFSANWHRVILDEGRRGILYCESVYEI